jgi:hypothetical protein
MPARPHTQRYILLCINKTKLNKTKQTAQREDVYMPNSAHIIIT